MYTGWKNMSSKTRETAFRVKWTHLGIGFSKHTWNKRHRIESERYSKEA
jgi:hypothetical protein